MKNEKTPEILQKLSNATFDGVKSKRVFKPAMIFGATLNDEIGILLTADKNAEKFSLQIGKNQLFLNKDSLDFLIKSIVILGSMVASESENAFREKMQVTTEEGVFQFARLMSSKASNEDLAESIAQIKNGTDSLMGLKKEESPVEETKEEVLLDTDAMLDAMLAEAESKPAISEKIEEGVMEYVSLEEENLQAPASEPAESLETAEEAFSLFKNQEGDAFDKMIADFEKEEAKAAIQESFSIQAEETEFKSSEEGIEESLKNYVNNASLEEEYIDDEDGFGQAIPGSASSPVFGRRAEEDDKEEEDVKATSGGPSAPVTPLIEDEEEDEEIDDDFLKRMEDVEGMLTGNFELLEEEIPTFEKIEKLKIEHGELAAKEYVASLSQEQREALVKERLASRIAAQSGVPAENQE